MVIVNQNNFIQIYVKDPSGHLVLKSGSQVAATSQRLLSPRVILDSHLAMIVEQEGVIFADPDLHTVSIQIEGRVIKSYTLKGNILSVVAFAGSRHELIRYFIHKDRSNRLSHHLIDIYAIPLIAFDQLILANELLITMQQGHF